MLAMADQIAWVGEARGMGDVCDNRIGTMGAEEFWWV